MARAEIHPFENEIFDHFRNEIKEKKKWIKKRELRWKTVATNFSTMP